MVVWVWAWLGVGGCDVCRVLGATLDTPEFDSGARYELTNHNCPECGEMRPIKTELCVIITHHSQEIIPMI